MPPIRRPNIGRRTRRTESRRTVRASQTVNTDEEHDARRNQDVNRYSNVAFTPHRAAFNYKLWQGQNGYDITLKMVDPITDTDSSMSELDRFKRRLVRSVSRLLLRERRPAEEVWETLRKGTGKDCKELWNRMRTLTIKKLARLLAADDHPAKVPGVARMTTTDWLMFDLALVHEDIDVIDQNDKLGKHADKSSPLWALMRLAMTFNVDAAAGARLAALWVSVAKNYNSNGRECSPMLLQRRWYQLKESSREKFYKFWMEWRGDARRMPAARPLAPSRVQAVLAKCNPGLITLPFVRWDELREQERVVSSEAVIAVIRNSQNAQKAPPEVDEPEVVLMEPKIPMIDLGADSDEETSKQVTDRTERTSQSIENTQLVSVKTEPIEQIDEGDDCLGNIQIVQATHVPSEDFNLTDQEALTKTKVALKTELDENITITETVIAPPEQNAATAETIAEDDITFHKEIIATNVILEDSENEDDLILYDDSHLNAEQSKVTNDAPDSNAATENATVGPEVMSAEIDFVDDGIEMIDEGDEGEYLSENTNNYESKETTTSHNTSDDNLAKIDLKLIMSPVVYTVKLDHMASLKDKPIDSVESKELIKAILEESKPVTEKVEIEIDINTPVDSNNEKHNIQDDINKLEHQDRLNVEVEIQVDKEKKQSLETTTKDEESSDEEVERVSLNKAMFKKPNNVEYSPIQLCKNPDFNTRLKRLNVMFYAFERNRQYLKACKPMTIDLEKSFESKLQNNTIYLKPYDKMKLDGEIKQEPVSNTVNSALLPSAVPAQCLMDQTVAHIPDPIPSTTKDLQNDPIVIEPLEAEDEKPLIKTNPQHKTMSNLSVKCIPSTSNPNIKYLEVAMNYQNNENQQIESSQVRAMTTSQSKNGNVSEVNLLNQGPREKLPADVYTDQGVISATMNAAGPQQTQPCKTIAKKKTTIKIPWYHSNAFARGPLPEWTKGRKPKNIIPRGSLLTLDALNKMLRICLETDGAPSITPPITPIAPIAPTTDPNQTVKKKKKKYQPKLKPKAKNRYCCWIKEFYSTKEFTELGPHPCINAAGGCTCCCRRNDGAREPAPSTSEAIDVANPEPNEPKEITEINKSVTDLTNDDKDEPTVQENLMKCAPKNKARRVSLNKKIVTNDDMTRTAKEIGTKLQTQNENIDLMTNIEAAKLDAQVVATVPIKTRIFSQLPPLSTIKQSVTHTMGLQADMTNNVAKESVVGNALPVVPLLPAPPPLLEITVEPHKESPGGMFRLNIQQHSNTTINTLQTDQTNKELSECIVLSDDENDPAAFEISTEQQVVKKRKRGRPRKIRPYDSTIRGLIDRAADNNAKLLPDNNNAQNMLYLQEFLKESPFDVGKNRILLTTAKIPAHMYKLGKVATSPPKAIKCIEAPLVELPRGIKFAVVPGGELTCYVDIKLFDASRISELPDIVERVRNQLQHCSSIPIIYNAAFSVADSAPVQQNVFNVESANEIPTIDLDNEPEIEAEVTSLYMETVTNQVPDAQKDVGSTGEPSKDDSENKEVANEDKNMKGEDSTTHISDKPVDTEAVENQIKTCDQQEGIEIDADTGESKISFEKEIPNSSIEKSGTEDDEKKQQEQGENPSKEHNKLTESQQPLISVKDFAVFNEAETAVSTKKTILSDLMEMSGISADDTSSEPIPSAPIFIPALQDFQSSTSLMPTMNQRTEPELLVPNVDPATKNMTFRSVEGTLQLTPVTSLEILKYARMQNALFYRLDLVAGTIVSTQVSIVEKNKRSHKAPKDAVIVDLTKPNKDVVEVHSLSKTGARGRQTHVLMPTGKGKSPYAAAPFRPTIVERKKTNQQRYLNLLKSLLKANSSKVQTFFPNGVSGQKKSRKEKIASRIDTEDSDTPMEEEYLSDSSGRSLQSVKTYVNKKISNTKDFHRTRSPIINRVEKAADVAKKSHKLSKNAKRKKPRMSDSDDSDDEPLAKKISRIAEDTNKDEELEEEHLDPDMNSSFSIEGLIDEIMSDDEDFILGA